MPGRTPHQAVDRFLSPLQLAVSCVSNNVVVHRGEHILNQPCTILVGEGGSIKLRGRSKLILNITLNYEIVRDPNEAGSHKIHTTAYSYSIRDRQNKELLRYDWHPAIDPNITYPHLHIEDSKWKKFHLPTSRIALEQVLRLLITQFEVRTKRRDWATILTRGQRALEDHCSWHFEPR